MKNSRGHRAFGGFSLGAVTTWYQFIYNLDCVKYFLPMSGDCWIIATYGYSEKFALCNYSRWEARFNGM